MFQNRRKLIRQVGRMNDFELLNIKKQKRSNHYRLILRHVRTGREFFFITSSTPTCCEKELKYLPNYIRKAYRNRKDWQN